MGIQSSKLLCISQVAELLGIKYYAAQTLFHSKAFPRIQIGERFYVREQSLVKFLENQEQVR